MRWVEVLEFSGRSEEEGVFISAGLDYSDVAASASEWTNASDPPCNPMGDTVVVVRSLALAATALIHLLALAATSENVIMENGNRFIRPDKPAAGRARPINADTGRVESGRWDRAGWRAERRPVDRVAARAIAGMPARPRRKSRPRPRCSGTKNRRNPAGCAAISRRRNAPPHRSR